MCDKDSKSFMNLFGEVSAAKVFFCGLVDEYSVGRSSSSNASLHHDSETKGAAMDCGGKQKDARGPFLSIGRKT